MIPEIALSDRLVAFQNAFDAVGTSSRSGVHIESQVPDYWPTSGWRKSSPEMQGMSSAKLNEMMQYIRQQAIGIDSVVVVRNGYVVMEEYPRPLLYGPQNPHPLYSVTKSFSSALIGIAIKEGFIDGVQHKVLDFFPNRTFANMDSRKEAITLEHLLTMTSGLPWDEWTYPYGDPRNDATAMMLSPDPVQFVLDRPMVSIPGTTWVYNGGGSHLLSAIVNETTSTDTEEFARERLFSPLGISNLFWGRDPFQHLPWGFMGMSLTPLDMAKFGYLYLNNGTWEGQQIIPTEWVTESTRPHYSAWPGWRYGYQWWIGPASNVFVARGYMGQNIIVAPDYNMVVVFTGSYLYGPEGTQLFYDYVLPAVGPTVPDDHATIQEAINAASDGDAIFVRSGKYYENLVVNRTVSLVGEDSSTTIVDGGGAGHVILVTSDSVNITGFTVQNSGAAYHITGINLNNVSHCGISGNILINNEHGLEIHNFSYCNTVSGNNITENNKWGMHIIDSHNNSVSGNTIGGSIWGSIAIHGVSTYNRIFENNIQNNDNVGLSIDNSDYNSIYENNITNNKWGISVQYDSKHNAMSFNNIENNEYGIKLESNTYANVFYHNNLVNNTFRSSLIGYNVNFWDDGYPFGGNYWSDYDGVDLRRGFYQNETGSDGIGDSSVILDGNNMDHYPLMTPWGETSNLVGDVNADGKVDMKDVGYVARRFMCVPGDPRWDPMADTNNDEKTDMVDIGTVARHFGDCNP